MTSLQFLILSTIHRHGPQSDMALWGHTKSESLTAVVIAIATLEDDGLIENTPMHRRPRRYPMAHDPVVYWQLTGKGQQLAASRDAASDASQKEVLPWI